MESTSYSLRTSYLALPRAPPAVHGRRTAALLLRRMLGMRPLLRQGGKQAHASCPQACGRGKHGPFVAAAYAAAGRPLSRRVSGVGCAAASGAVATDFVDLDQQPQPKQSPQQDSTQSNDLRSPLERWREFWDISRIFEAEEEEADGKLPAAETMKQLLNKLWALVAPDK